MVNKAEVVIYAYLKWYSVSNHFADGVDNHIIKAYHQGHNLYMIKMMWVKWRHHSSVFCDGTVRWCIVCKLWPQVSWGHVRPIPNLPLQVVPRCAGWNTSYHYMLRGIEHQLPQPPRGCRSQNNWSLFNGTSQYLCWHTLFDLNVSLLKILHQN